MNTPESLVINFIFTMTQHMNEAVPAAPVVSDCVSAPPARRTLPAAVAVTTDTDGTTFPYISVIVIVATVFPPATTEEASVLAVML